MGEAGLGVVGELGGEVGEAAGGGGLAGEVVLAALGQALGLGGGQEQGAGLGGGGQASGGQGGGQLGLALPRSAARWVSQLGLQVLVAVLLNFQRLLLVGQLGLG